MMMTTRILVKIMVVQQHPITTQQQQNLKQAESAVDDSDVFNSSCDIETVSEVNSQLSRPDEVPDVGGSCVDEIVAYDWRLGQVHFKVKWSSGDTT